MSETATGGGSVDQEFTTEDKFGEAYIELETAIIDCLFEIGGTRYDDEEERMIHGDAMTIVESIVSAGFSLTKGDVTIGRS